MSYIINTTSPFISVKLTQTGREKLSMGKLNFSYWAAGDSEINYEREALIDSNDVTLSATSKIMRPFDRQPNIKYYIKPANSASPFQTISNGDISVIKAVVNNLAIERGFFNYSGSSYITSTATTLTPYSQPVNNSTITGGTVLFLSSTSNINVGDLLLLRLSNNLTGNISTGTTTPTPNLWFKVQNKTLSSVTVDRTLPNNSSNSSTSSMVIIYKGGEVYDTIATGNTTAYWDSGTLGFQSNVNVTCYDVPVWNMNNVWCENLAGITGLTGTSIYEDYTKFGSYQYIGTKNPYMGYLCQTTATTLAFDCNGPGMSYLDDVKKSISILHYTNNTISSLYGEFLFIDSTSHKRLTISLPDLMYHRRNYSTASGTTMGMSFIATGSTKFIDSTDIEYVELIEDPTLIPSGVSPNVIGRVYPQLKVVVIHDDEIVSAISYKSNRNWTLPPLEASISSPSGGTSTGVLDVNKTVYLTYSLENSGTTGITTSLPCQTYIKLTNNSSSAKDITFRISEIDQLPYMRKYESSNYDGLGFYAKKFKLLYQIVDDIADRPDPGLWKTYDYTTTAITTIAGATIDPKLLENPNSTTTGFVLDKIKDSGATIFDITQSLNMAPNLSPSNLQFGDERFFYGNLNTYIGATIYKTVFNINIGTEQFNSTTNPTRSTDVSTNPPKIKVSEVGIYDSDKNLVCIGKLAIPISLEPGNIIMIECSLDF